LLGVPDEFVDLLADNLAPVGLVGRGDATFEQVPPDLASSRGATAAGFLLLPVPVIEHLKAQEFVDVFGGQGSLIELHAKLLHPKGGDADHMESGLYGTVVVFRSIFLIGARIYDRLWSTPEVPYRPGGLCPWCRRLCPHRRWAARPAVGERHP